MDPAAIIWVIIVSISVAWCSAAVGAIAAAWRRTQGIERREIVFWALVSLIGLTLMSGLVPWFWTFVPVVAKVQFPWRLLIVVEFTALTALCLVPWSRRDRMAGTTLAAAAVALAGGVTVMGSAIVHRVEFALSGDYMAPQDAKEYLPAGYPQRAGAGYADLGLEPIKDVAPITCTPVPRLCRADEERFGAMQVTVDSDEPTHVVLRRFYFPAWRLSPNLPIAPTDLLRLVSFTAPAGRQTYSLQRRALPAEQWGGAISGLSLALLMVWTALDWRIRRP